MSWSISLLPDPFATESKSTWFALAATLYLSLWSRYVGVHLAVSGTDSTGEPPEGLVEEEFDDGISTIIIETGFEIDRG